MSSGRCWLFAALNLLRADARKKLGVKNFEFSQNHAMYWDKLERANYFLEDMIAVAGSAADERIPMFLLGNVLDDGGQEQGCRQRLPRQLHRHGRGPAGAVQGRQRAPRAEGRCRDRIRRPDHRRLRRRRCTGRSDARQAALIAG